MHPESNRIIILDIYPELIGLINWMYPELNRIKILDISRVNQVQDTGYIQS